MLNNKKILITGGTDLLEKNLLVFCYKTISVKK